MHQVQVAKRYNLYFDCSIYYVEKCKKSRLLLVMPSFSAAGLICSTAILTQTSGMLCGQSRSITWARVAVELQPQLACSPTVDAARA